MHRNKLLSLILLLPLSSLALGSGGAPAPLQGDAAQDKPVKNTCTAKCHKDLHEGKVLHEPAKLGECDSCHITAEDDPHDFKPIENVGKLCQLCHQLELHDTVHKPIADGQCVACHDPHQSGTKGLLKVENEEAELCAQCHEQPKLEDREFVHGPAATGKCSLCHLPHSSEGAKLLAGEEIDNCLKCHSELAKDLEESDIVHGPVTLGCALCHDPHASDHEHQLKSDVEGLCLKCHGPIKQRIEASNVKHGALTSEDRCVSCHRPHVAKFPKLLDTKVADVCMKCHEDAVEREGAHVVPAIGKQLKQKKYVHGPLREGDCSSCHDVHGSEHGHLVRDAYPERFYAPFDPKNYALCFRCHESRIFETPKTATLTSFRDGDRNLHYLHVHKERKGRTCRACHEAHASNLPKHLAENVRFGGWQMPMNFQKAPTGGSCAPGCHSKKEYDWSKTGAEGESQGNGK